MYIVHQTLPEVGPVYKTKYTRHTHVMHTSHVTHTRHTHTHITQAELELVLVIAHGQMNMTTTLSNLSVATTTYQSRYTPIAKVTNLID